MSTKAIEIPLAAALRAANRYSADDQGCFISAYSVNSAGYAQIGWSMANRPGGSVMTTAHRAAWSCRNGQIPAGMTVDHTCKNRRCVRVDHLRLLSNYENARRTSGRDWPIGTCINGHSNSELRTEPNGRVRCRPCKAKQQRTYRDRKAAARTG